MLAFLLGLDLDRILVVKTLVFSDGLTLKLTSVTQRHGVG